jgi:hypothetical protein
MEGCLDPIRSKASIELLAVLLKEAEKQGLLDRALTAFKTKPRNIKFV